VQSLQKRERSRRPLGSLNRMAPAQAGASFVSTPNLRMIRDFSAGVGQIRNERLVGQDTESRRTGLVKRMRDYMFDGAEIRIKAGALTSPADGFASIWGERLPLPASVPRPSRGPFSVTPSAGTPRNAPVTARRS
jgi:hypothetical protein